MFDWSFEMTPKWAKTERLLCNHSVSTSHVKTWGETKRDEEMGKDRTKTNLLFLVPLSEFVTGINVMQPVHVEAELSVKIWSSNKWNFVSDNSWNCHVYHEPAALLVVLGSGITTRPLGWSLSKKVFYMQAAYEKEWFPPRPAPLPLCQPLE